MIRYLISLADLETKIGPRWLKKARARTAKLKALGHFKEKTSIWSEIKHIYMTLQGDSKCIFCERKLESQGYGKGEQAVEHFRPKGDVKNWVLSQELVDLGVKVTLIAENNIKGYHLLAYHPLNYSASCIPCNSALKSNYFPVAGAYDLEAEDPVALAAENPYLIYPLGDFDDDPEELIAFNGVSPFAKKRSGFARQRALVTLEFFKLNDSIGRKNLFRERANIIIALYPQLKNRSSNTSTAAEKAVAQLLINGFTASNSSHVNCARCFVKLYEKDPAEAEEFFLKAAELVKSSS